MLVKGFISLCCAASAAQSMLVLQTDFGLEDHAVAAMHGVARQLDPGLAVDDLTHEIPAFDVWQAAYRLHGSVTGTIPVLDSQFGNVWLPRGSAGA